MSTSTNGSDDGEPTRSGQKELRFIDFYSGVGGWTTALHLACENASGYHPNGLSLKCCAALDHSDLCTSVYQHNHPCSDAHVRQYRIDELTSNQLNIWKAHMWLMSPPCQPHTRQHSNQTNDLQDARSASFLHLTHLLASSQMDEAAIPSLILLENVVGFEHSNSFHKFCQALESRDYQMAQFILEPTQIGFPNERPRYYCVAIRSSNEQRSIINEQSALYGYFQRLVASATGIPLVPVVKTAIPEMQVYSKESCHTQTISEFLDNPSSTGASELCVPPEILTRTAAWCFDIVTPTSTRSSCFTSGYGRFIRGTGSILYTPGEACPSQMELLDSQRIALQDPQDREFQTDWISKLNIDASSLRYFSGTEMARLLGFPMSFSFPAGVTLKQQWKLMGNSLNVGVAMKLIELGLQVLKFR